jgi:hypothetical protein
MAKGKSEKKKKPGRRAESKTQDDGSAEIRRAEKRLAAALAVVDEAREKVQRRERDLAQLMDRHGRTAPVSTTSDEAIPLEATSQTASENGAPHAEAEPVEVEPVEAGSAEAELAEHAESAEGDGHHE